MSQPHFLNADKKFLNSVIGLKPDKNKHDFIVLYEPVSKAVLNTKLSFFLNYQISGASLGGNVRLQLNFYLNAYEQVK